MAGQLFVIGLGVIVFAAGAFFGKVFVDPYMLTRGQKIGRAIGIAAAVLGGFIAFGAFFEAAPPRPGEGLPWHVEADLDEALATAKAEGKPVLIDFWTESCTNCKVLERETFSNPDVAALLRADFVLIKLNTNTLYSDHQPVYERLKEAYGNIDAQPFIVFLNGHGEYLENLSFHGLKDTATVQAVLPKVKEANAESGAQSAGLARRIQEEGLLLVLLLLFVGGLGASLTPCVYPLIPLTISIFGAHAAKSRLAAFGLSAIYVAGIVVCFTVLGLVAASVGRGIGQAMSNPWVLAGLAVVFVAMGLASLGAYEIALPASLQQSLSGGKGKGVVRVFLMGVVAGLLATPCVGPILVSVLIFVAQTQDMVLGALLLATFALGLGMLFLVVGTFAGLLARLPRSGPWMIGVKTLFGLIFIVVALYYLKGALPAVKAPVTGAWLLARLAGFA